MKITELFKEKKPQLLKHLRLEKLNKCEPYENWEINYYWNITHTKNLATRDEIITLFWTCRQSDQRIIQL